RAGALLIGSSALFLSRRRQLAALATRHGPPAIGIIREFVLAGGLMSYGASDTDAYRRAGAQYVARILKGAKPRIHIAHRRRGARRSIRSSYFASSGGLMSFGTEVLDTYRQAASYVDRILKGERPAEHTSH